MMDIVTGCSRESPLDFRANPQIKGTARRPYKRMIASEHNGRAPSKTMAMHKLRIHAEYAVITALIGIASSVVGAAQVPVTTWPRSDWAHAATNEPMHQVTAGMQKGTYCANNLWKLHGEALTASIRPAPVGDVTPEPQIPAPTAKVIAPPVAAPPPRAEQPLSPPRQPAAPAPQPEAPGPQPEAPAPQSAAPAPPPEAPPPQQEAPPSQRPRGHVQLAP